MIYSCSFHGIRISNPICSPISVLIYDIRTRSKRSFPLFLTRLTIPLLHLWTLNTPCRFLGWWCLFLVSLVTKTIMIKKKMMKMIFSIKCQFFISFLDDWALFCCCFQPSCATSQQSWFCFIKLPFVQFQIIQFMISAFISSSKFPSFYTIFSISGDIIGELEEISTIWQTKIQDRIISLAARARAPLIVGGGGYVMRVIVGVNNISI